MNTIGRWLRPEDVVLDVEIADKAALFDLVAQRIERESGLARRYVAHCLQRREQAGSTAIGAGVALPHARIEGLRGIHAMYLRPRRPLVFGAADAIPVTDILVLLVPDPAAQEHLDLLADAARLFANGELRQGLHTARTASEITPLLSG